MPENIPLNASAVLIWLPAGKSPNDNDFNAKALTAPPHPNPEPWWFAGEAIRYAYELTDKGGKLPWLKIGKILLSPDEVLEAAEAIPKGYRGDHFA
ncbi:hypothetical protein [Methylocella sp.]|jgi:hypothetical protein|uniref:hypothetical protein n=1 Tax=Methylocella sp. TaxID=1978226 RepID=UPI003C1BCA5B